MINMSLYFQAVLMLLIVFSSLACGIIILASLRDSQSREEKKLKVIATTYMAMFIHIWLALFFYRYAPRMFAYLNVVTLVVFVTLPIVFYRMIRLLTNFGKGQKERFGYLHYFIPIVLGATLLIWSFFVPFSVQLEIVESKSLVMPTGYEAYARLYTSKPFWRVFFGLIYNGLTIALLYRYYRQMPKTDNSRRKPAVWILSVVAISLILVFNAFVTLLVPENRIYTSPWVVLSVVFVIAQQILLTWHIIRRKYLLYVDTPKPVAPEQLYEAPPQNDMEEKALRHHQGKISRRILEAYFRREKPYLNPDFKITDLVEGLDVNRTMISGFINDTYGVNFNRYLNRWRLAEAQRLMALPSNRGKSPQKLVTNGGFTNTKHYLRALRAEENDSNHTKEMENDQ